MKKIYQLMAFPLLFLVQQAAAQDRAYVKDEIIKVTGITSDNLIYSLTPTQKQTSITYYDGMGRPLQAIQVQGSPLQNDLIQPVAYNPLGQQTTSYLPYAGKSTDVMGSYRPNAITTDQPAFYNATTQHLYATDTKPSAAQLMENSPLQRLLEAGMPGTGFQPGVAGNHWKTASYRSNTAADGNILVWNPDGTFTASTYYAVNMLAVSDGKDEDNTETLTFTDIAGHLILKRQILSTGNLDTYYIYNLGGMISFIVPPLATTKLAANSYSLTGAILSTLVFHFVYDTNGRLVEKTVPGKGKMSIVYDPLNRPVLMQDAVMLAANQWNYIKYDAQDRAVCQGIYTDVTTTPVSHIGRVNMQAYVNTLSWSTAKYETRTATQTNFGYYTSTIFPTATTGTLLPLAYVYYDDYYMTQSASPDFSYVVQGDAALPNEESATTAQLKGMPTILSQTTVGTGLTNTWLTTATFYDRNLHPIQVRSNNHVYYTGYTTSATLTDTKTVVNDFTGTPLISKVAKQTGASTTTTVYTSISYDHMYRVTGVSQKYNTGSFTNVAAYSYNELGQLIQKNLGQIASGTIPANISLSTYSATTATATNSITLTTGFAVPSGSSFSAFISTGYLQTVDMRYNLRGQLLSINNSKLGNDGGVTNNDNTDLFGMQLMYDQPADANLGNTPYYNGKLSAVKWMSKDGSGNPGYERAYNYYYDAMNRDTAAIYAERTTASTGAFTTTHGWDEDRITYDQNGNLLTLFRNSTTQASGTHSPIDNLAYAYDPNSPNQLKTVTDGTGAGYTGAGFRNLTGSTGNYTYDVNGNLAADPYKGLTLQYDVLNKTDKITVTTSVNRYINYIYNAGGALIRKMQYDNNVLQTTTDYLDGMVFTTAGAGAATLAYFAMPEGRVLNNAGTLSQEFTISDQQGNVRIAFDNTGAGGTAKVRQENSYYAFGLVMPNSPVATPTNPNKHLYNGGSEWQNDYSNLPDYYQTPNRNYDAATARFISVDPMAESAESMTPYQYAGNNPVMNNDPTGNVTSNTYNGPGSLNDPSLVGYYGIYYLNSIIGNTEYGSSGYGGPDGTFGGPSSRYATDLIASARNGNPAAIAEYGYLYGTIGNKNDYLQYFCQTCGISYFQESNGQTDQLPNGGPTNNYNVATSTLTSDKQYGNVQHNSYMAVTVSDWQTLTGGEDANQGGGHLNDFIDGFVNAPYGGFTSSSATSMANLQADAAESILKNAGSASREMAVASKVLGKTLGIAGVAYTAYNAYNQKGGFTAGDWVKVGIGAALIVNPIGWIGIGYAGLDILTEITTGTSITDRVGNGVNNMVKNW